MIKTKSPIDLSQLTTEEIQQFIDDPSTLQEGDTDVCLYMRYSSDKQSEQSIEGQLRDIRAYCKSEGYRIRAIYVDRATTARKDVDKRVSFMQMVSDSSLHLWEAVVVWKLDRFARNRTDSAMYKYKLRKNGVQVLSATERISDQPEGIILEAVLEGMAEFYSADLSQKITRGLRESALKGFNVGGHIPLGYRIENKKLVIDENTAHIVQEAFQLYADGETVAEICRIFNSKGYKTAKNSEFNRNSFKTMFRNKRYIGIYTYKDIEVEDAVPPIISKNLFDEVQRRLKATADAPARGTSKADYLLAGKLFCGHCGEHMIGDCGTGRNGVLRHYYSCHGKKHKKNCNKKSMPKDWLETIVVQDAMSMMTDEVIDEMANIAMKQSDQDIVEHTRIPELTARKQEAEKGIANITKAIEKGIASDALMNRLMELEDDKKKTEKLLAEEEKYIVRLDKDQIVFWLSKFKNGNINSVKFRRTIINLLINSVTVWDDDPDGFKITTAYNLTSCGNRSYTTTKDCINGFDIGTASCTIGSKVEPFVVIGTIFIQTKKHSLP